MSLWKREWIIFARLCNKCQSGFEKSPHYRQSTVERSGSKGPACAKRLPAIPSSLMARVRMASRVGCFAWA
jgi:hypothetical protein